MNYNEEASRGLWIDVLLDEKSDGWAVRSTVRQVAVTHPELSGAELEQLARRLWPAAWAYRDELAAKPSNELCALALSVAERQRNERAAAERTARQEAEKALFVRWARKPYWSPKEAVALLLGCDPNGSGWPVKDDDKADDLTDLLERAIKAGKLKRDLSPALLLNWLKGRRVAIPPELAEEVERLIPLSSRSLSVPDPAAPVRAVEPVSAEQKVVTDGGCNDSPAVRVEFVLSECERIAGEIGEVFDREDMPGQKGQFLELMKKLEPGFKKMSSVQSLYRYLRGQCKWSLRAKSNPDATPLYQKLFPEAWGNPGAVSENRKKA